MEIRYFIDPETGSLHIHRHDVAEDDVEDVLRRPIEDRPSRDGSRVAIGRSLFRHHGLLAWLAGTEGAAPQTPEEEMTQSKFPPGWDEARVRRVLEHYEAQSDAEAVAEDEAAYEATTHTMMEIPVELVPVVRELIAKRGAE